MKIFISYRRNDSSDVTGRIYDRLSEEFGRNSIYRDLDVIPFGIDFSAHIDQALKTSDVFLAVIGPQWVTITGKSGKRRIEEENDFVRLEVAIALKRNIPVIPLFIGGMNGLDPDQLPEDLKPLALRNGIVVRGDPDFHRDLDRLIDNLRRNKGKVSAATWESKSSRSRQALKNLQRTLNWFYIVPLLLACLLGGIFLSLMADLPSVDDLKNHVSQFETTHILDSNGNLLADITDPNGGRRTYVSLDHISPPVLAATIAVEDPTFYSNSGFNAWTAIQSLVGNRIEEDISIAQKLAGLLLLSPEEREQRSFRTRLREIILAYRITKKYNKDDILQIYLSELYYGNSAYGIEAAAELYFGKTANQLSLAEASFLAGIPQSPSRYDIYTHREETVARHQQVLVLMYQLSQSEGCIPVSNSETRICVDAVAAADAADDIKNRAFDPPSSDNPYAYWASLVRAELERQFDPQTFYQNGFLVYATIDPELQKTAEELISQHLGQLAPQHVTNAALVAIRPSTGEILAMVTSADNTTDSDGQPYNALMSPRNPGSLLQPIIYLTAFEKGWTPATWIADDDSELPTSGHSYPLENFDRTFHGKVTVRTGLANAYNIPAIKAIQFAGLSDEGVLSVAKRLGITSLTGTDYDLSLPVDGGEVNLLEMTRVYAVFANVGRQMPPVTISRIIDKHGNTIYSSPISRGEQVIRQEHAYLITSILSDEAARQPAFGQNSLLNTTFPAAVMTGTTYDQRDAWTIGYTPDIVVGVWVGNPDNTKMTDVTGLTGAAPIWAEFLSKTIDHITEGNPTGFLIPAGIVNRPVCTVYVDEAGPCPSSREEPFASDQLP